MYTNHDAGDFLMEKVKDLAFLLRAADPDVYLVVHVSCDARSSKWDTGEAHCCCCSAGLRHINV